MSSPHKIMEQCRLCPAKLWSLRSLPCTITEPSFFALQNYGAMQTLPRKNHGDIVLGAKIKAESILKLDVNFLFF